MVFGRTPMERALRTPGQIELDYGPDERAVMERSLNQFAIPLRCKVHRFGHSRGVLIPRVLAKYLGLEVGDLVTVVIQRAVDGHNIAIAPSEPAPLPIRVPSPPREVAKAVAKVPGHWSKRTVVGGAKHPHRR